MKDSFGRRVTALLRLGKRIVLSPERDLHLVIHLMIADRVQWKDEPETAIPDGRDGLAAVDFDSGALIFTEAGTKNRASLLLSWPQVEVPLLLAPQSPHSSLARP